MPDPRLRDEPNPAVSSASPAATDPDFRGVDRLLGGLVVNRLSSRILRVLTRFLVPPVNRAGVEVAVRAEAGVTVVTPEVRTGQGAVLLVHGGGYVIGSPRDVVPKAAAMARACGVPVVLPRYRLAPEAPFPAGHEDCLAAWRWLLAEADALEVDRQSLVVGGYSAGGGHAAALAQRIHDEGGPQPSGQLLVYPMLDDRTAQRRELDALDHRVWNNRSNRYGWSSYLGRGGPQPYAVPARREELAGLAPAWIGVGTPDLFLDEDRVYARRLREAGVDVTYVEADGAIHAFDIAQKSSLTRAFEASIHRFVRRHVGSDARASEA